jgi:hypothetical protein
MPSDFDQGEEGWIFPESNADETQVARGGRASPPVPPALRGGPGQGGQSGPDHFGQDAGVFGVDRNPQQHPGQQPNDPFGQTTSQYGQPANLAGRPDPQQGWEQQPQGPSVWDQQPQQQGGWDQQPAWGDPGPGGDQSGGGFWDGDRGGGQPLLLDDDWASGFDDERGGSSGGDGGGGRGGVLIFLVGLVVVVLAALGFAALNTLGILGGDDAADTAVGETAAADNATVEGETELGDQVFGGDDAAPSEQPVEEATPDPNALVVELIEDPFVCDGGTREFARLTNAEPNEQVAFVSPQSPNLRAGTADETGTVTMRWVCDSAQAPTVWEIAATGATSNRSVVFAFRGVVEATATTDPDQGEADPTPGTGGSELLVSISENPFACNGEARPFARITGADANEQVRFSSPESPNLRAGTADADGALDVRWQCDPAQAGTTWNLTATGDQSGRSVTFSVTGTGG